MKKPLISIIIPIYNVQNYIADCICSVINQTFTDSVECLLVDDCGSDDSIVIAEKIIDSYKGKIKFRIINHNSNLGLSCARNTGIRESDGEWLLFLDSDDWLSENCLQTMVDMTTKYPSCELVIGGAIKTDGDDIFDLENSNFPDYVEDRNWINRNLLTPMNLPVTAWNKLIKKDFVNKHQLYFVESAISEDEYWNFLLAKYVSCMVILKHNTYFYRVREGSIMNCGIDLLRNWLKISSYMIDHCGERYKRNEVISIFNSLEFRMRHINDDVLYALYRKMVVKLLRVADIKQSVGIMIFLCMNRYIRGRQMSINLVSFFIGHL